MEAMRRPQNESAPKSMAVPHIQGFQLFVDGFTQVMIVAWSNLKP